MDCDIAVIGAGPAGLAAAVAAATAGARVVLVDAADRPGGQYFRHPPESVEAVRAVRLHHGWARFVRLREALNEHIRAGRVDYVPGHSVWYAEPMSEADGESGARFTLHLNRPGGSRSAETQARTAAQARTEVQARTGAQVRAAAQVRTEVQARTEAQVRAAAQVRWVRARAIVIAAGAHDRALPFPGWDLPGVLTAGGAQALLKGNLVLAGSRAVVAGSGPFLLPVAAGLAAAGTVVAGVFEAGRPGRFARHAPTVARNAGKLAEGAGYAAALLRHRVPYRVGHAVIAAHGQDAVAAVTVARLDRDWTPVPGSERVVPCDTLAVGYGFTPQLEIPVELGCATRTDADGSLVVSVDAAQRTSLPWVYAAGETTGVGGAELALAEGELAGIAAAGALGAGEATPPRRLTARRARLRSFATALHDAYAVRPGWMGWVRDDTLVCRCEEVPYGRLVQAVGDLGATDARAAKLISRAGMGWCQGRICGYPMACLTARILGSTPDVTGLARRPLAQPVRLGDLAEEPDLGGGGR